jgi:hypothetical protein
MSEYSVRQEEDRVDARKLLAIGGGAIVIGTAAVLFAAALLPRPSKAPSAVTPPPEISTVEQTPTLAAERGIVLRRAQRAALADFRWVDRDAGVASIPIDVAIEILGRGEK